MPKFVVLRNGEWHVRRVFPTTEQTKKGKTKYIEISRKCIPETEDRARELSDAIEGAYRRELEQTGRPLTLSEFAEQFLEAKASHVRRRTLDFYRWIFERHIESDQLGRKMLDQVKPIDVQTFYKRLAAAGVSASTVRKVHTLLAMMFRQALAWEAIDKIPTAGVMVPRFVRKESKAMSWDEARSFIEAARSQDAVIFEFALETGMRPGEYLALTWNDIDFGKRLVRVTKSVTSGLKGGGTETGEPKTRSGKRTIEISAELAGRLAFHMEQQAIWVNDLRRVALSNLSIERRKSAKRILDTIQANGLVFPSTTGTSRAYHNLEQRDLQRVLETAGLKDKGYNLYTLRHTMVSLSLESGANIKAISEKVGHASIQITLDVYAHLIGSLVSFATEALAAGLYRKNEPAPSEASSSSFTRIRRKP